MGTKKLLLNTIIGSITLFLALFVSSGRINFWQGWLFLFLNSFNSILDFFLMQKNPDLANERFKPGPGTKWWDMLFIVLSLPTYIGILIVAGLDTGRYHWSPKFHASVYVLGLVCFIGGQTIFLIAKRQNKFFSSVVRIQKERNHAVCDKGLYKMIRHPGYLGTIISSLGIPMLLGSLWSAIPTLIYISLFVVRTYLEDITLFKELNGYQNFCLNVKYRIVKGVW